MSHLFLAASKQKESAGMAFFMLGMMYQTGDGVPRNEELAFKNFEKAAEYKIPVALNNLGNKYYEGNQVPKDYRRAFQLYEEAAINREEHALFSLGVMYATGRGVEKNIATALNYFRQAENHGCNWANDYFTESPDPKEKEAFEIYKLRNKTSFELTHEAFKYYQGAQGHIKDDKEAFDLYMAASQHEKPAGLAFYNLGVMYQNGEGVQKDEKLAFDNFEKAAEYKIPAAINNLGRMHYEGRMVPQNYAKAFELYEEAAKKGSGTALFNLGVMYATGRGVEKNIATALNYFQEAEKRGARESVLTDYFTNPTDPEEKKAAKIYERRKNPLGFLVREEDQDTIFNWAETHKKGALPNYGRALIFAGLAAVFSDDQNKKNQSSDYIKSIQKDPPFRNRQQITDLSNFIALVTEDNNKNYNLKNIRETYHVDDPFMILMLSLMTAKDDIKNIESVQNKLRESMVSHFADQFKIYPMGAEAEYKNMLSEVKKLIASSQEEKKKDASSEKVIYHYEPLPPNAVMAQSPESKHHLANIDKKVEVEKKVASSSTDEKQPQMDHQGLPQLLDVPPNDLLAEESSENVVYEYKPLPPDALVVMEPSAPSLSEMDSTEKDELLNTDEYSAPSLVETDPIYQFEVKLGELQVALKSAGKNLENVAEYTNQYVSLRKESTLFPKNILKEKGLIEQMNAVGKEINALNKMKYSPKYFKEEDAVPKFVAELDEFEKMLGRNPATLDVNACTNKHALLVEKFNAIPEAVLKEKGLMDRINILGEKVAALIKNKMTYNPRHQFASTKKPLESQEPSQNPRKQKQKKLLGN